MPWPWRARERVCTFRPRDSTLQNSVGRRIQLFAVPVERNLVYQTLHLCTYMFCFIVLICFVCWLESKTRHRLLCSQSSNYVMLHCLFGNAKSFGMPASHNETEEWEHRHRAFYQNNEGVTRTSRFLWIRKKGAFLCFHISSLLVGF